MTQVIVGTCYSVEPRIGVEPTTYWLRRKYLDYNQWNDWTYFANFYVPAQKGVCRYTTCIPRENTGILGVYLLCLDLLHWDEQISIYSKYSLLSWAAYW